MLQQYKMMYSTKSFCVSYPTALDPAGHDSSGPQTLCGALAPLLTDIVFAQQLLDDSNKTIKIISCIISDDDDLLLLLLMAIVFFSDADAASSSKLKVLARSAAESSIYTR